MKKRLIIFYFFTVLPLARGSEDSLFKLLESLDHQMLEMMKSFDQSSESLENTTKILEYFYEEGKRGRFFVLRPNSQQSELKVKVFEGKIQISGNIKSETVKETQYGQSRSTSYQSIQRILPVPSDTDWKKHKFSSTKQGEIKVFFPYKDGFVKNIAPLPQSKSVTKEITKKSDKTNSKDEKMIPLFPRSSGPKI